MPRAVCSKGYTLADDGSSCVDDTAVAIGKGIYNNPLVQQAGNATQAGTMLCSAAVQQRDVDLHVTAACFLG